MTMERKDLQRSRTQYGVLALILILEAAPTLCWRPRCVSAGIMLDRGHDLWRPHVTSCGGAVSALICALISHPLIIIRHNHHQSSFTASLAPQ